MEKGLLMVGVIHDASSLFLHNHNPTYSCMCLPFFFIILSRFLNLQFSTMLSHVKPEMLGKLKES